MYSSVTCARTYDVPAGLRTQRGPTHASNDSDLAVILTTARVLVFVEARSPSAHTCPATHAALGLLRPPATARHRRLEPHAHVAKYDVIIL